MERLSDSELAGILGALGKEKQAQVDVQSISRQQKIEYALSKIGLYNGHMSLHAEGIAENALVARTLQTKMDKGEYDVFLAHNAKDKSIVLQIGGLLMRRGIYPWIDVQQVPPGSWWQDVTQAVMIKVKSAAIFLGTHSIGRWQAVEIRAFISQCLDRDIPVIPVLLPGVNEIPQDMGFLRELAWVQFPDIASIEGEALDRLIWGITGKRQSPLSDVV